MSIQNFVLLMTGILNLAMSIFIISRGWKNKVNLYFSLLTFFTFLWSLSIFLGRVLSADIWLFWAQTAYLAALGIAVSLFYFAIYFPFKLSKVNKITNAVILVPAILLAIMVYTDLFIVSYEKYPAEYVLYYNNLLYIFYAVYFSAVVLIAFYHLIYKYRHSEIIFKKQIKIFLSMITISFIFGSYFDLFLCYFGNFHYVWLGPLFTLFMNGSVFYLIFLAKHK